MKKKWIYRVLFVAVLCMCLAGCGSKKDTVEETDNTLTEDEDQYEEELEGDDLQADNGLVDPYTVEIGDDVFYLSEYTLEGKQNSHYKIEGSDSYLEAMKYEGSTASELANTMADSMKADSGEAASIDFHKEGVYITGLYQGAFCLSFLADGEDCTYILNLYTIDTDNGVDIMNSIIDDFLVCGFTEYTVRTEYGEEVQ